MEITRIFLKSALSFGGNGSFEGIFGENTHVHFARFSCRSVLNEKKIYLIFPHTHTHTRRRCGIPPIQ